MAHALNLDSVSRLDLLLASGHAASHGHAEQQRCQQELGVCHCDGRCACQVGGGSAEASQQPNDRHRGRGGSGDTAKGTRRGREARYKMSEIDCNAHMAACECVQARCFQHAQQHHIVAVFCRQQHRLHARPCIGQQCYSNLYQSSKMCRPRCSLVTKEHTEFVDAVGLSVVVLLAAPCFC